uniref:AAA-ATPase-like domain-containing protein n=1 Tax=Graphocephala atropunctata TaxID=36148 RepID=A0A1B6M5S4_9HEMI
MTNLFVLVVFIFVVSADQCTAESEETFQRFNVRSSDFAEIVSTASFIDKSMYIKTFVEDSGIVVVTAPHHFGKSTNLNMLKRFLEIEVNEKGNKKSKTINIREPVRDTENYALFVDNKLKITKNETFMNYHFGKHPVISVDFEFDNVHVMSYDIAVDQVKYSIHRSFVEHQYLKRSDRLNSEEKMIVKNWCSTSGYSKMTEVELSDSLRLLSRLLYRHYENRRVYVLIDNFDLPAVNALLFAETEDIMGGIYRLISTVVLKVLQKNFHSHRGLISGISYVAGSPALYSLGYVSVCRFLEDHDYAGFHGLTKEESVELFSRDIFNLSSALIGLAETNYGGYQSCGNVTLYNLWSVIHLLLTRQARDYWAGPGVFFNLENLLRAPAVQKEIIFLSKGMDRKVHLKKIYAPDDVIRLRDLILKPELHKDIHNSDLALAFLVELGYLTYVPTGQSFHGRKRVKIPNKEMRRQVLQQIKKYKQHYGAIEEQLRYATRSVD